MSMMINTKLDHDGDADHGDADDQHHDDQHQYHDGDADYSHDYL